MGYGRILVLTFLLLAPFSATADQLPKPKVEFSADTSMEASGLAMTGKIYHARDRERIEQHLQEMKVVVIARRDRNVGWMILDDQRSYLEMSLDEAKKNSLDINDCDATRKRGKEESANGVRTVKSRVSLSCPDGTSYDGSIWVTPDNIVVKMEAVATNGTESYPFRLDLKNLHIGHQDEKRFELPAGYRKLEIGGMLGAFGEMMKSVPDREMNAEWKEPSPATTATAAEKSSEITELKDLLGF